MFQSLRLSASINAFKQINFELLLVLVLTSLIPLIYSTTRIHFLGNLPEPWSFSIAAQVAWLNVGYEVLAEALLLPFAYILGQVRKHPKAYNIRISTGLILLLLAYAVVTVLVAIFTPQLVKGMQQQTTLIAQTVSYIRLEALGIFISSVFSFASLVLVLKNQKVLIYKLLILQTVLIILGDSLFVSHLSFSYQLGVNGIAWTNIITHSILAGISIVYLSTKGLSIKRIHFIEQSWLKDWLRVGWKSGLESLVRNTAFVVMILQLVNQVQQAGTYWLTNQFIWGWLLLPILAIGQLVKRDAANNNGLSTDEINGYMVLALVFVMLWLCSTAAWQWFIHQVMGVAEPQPVVHLALLMLGFYIVFAFNHVIDSYFYGIGRTDLMLYQSLIVNTFFYGSVFVAYQFGWFIPSLNKIAIMFGIGMTIDAFITAYLYNRLIKARQSQMINIVACANK
ncbi:MATE family Na+-driven efflux transporter [Shewanella sp. 10N.286.54.B9]|uniref:MATE family Na+-driven efflux transporter n=1 Tax=Shewanella sp. 10N.286.54.B9 TaxID=3229719 RepID=UPI00354E1767